MEIINEIEKEFLPILQSAFKSKYVGGITEWANKNIVLPIGYNPPGLFDAEFSRYLIAPLESLKNNHVRQVNIMACPRSGKTLLGEIYLSYVIANDAGNVLWLQSTENQSDKMTDGRMIPLLNQCQPVKDLFVNSRFGMTKKRFKFNNNMTVYLGSWGSKENLQSAGVQYVIGDEVWLAPVGMVGEVKARVGDFPDTSKILFISQGGTVNDDWNKEFENATIYEWGFTCPHCNKEQPLYFSQQREDGTFSGLNWNHSAKTNDIWNYKQAGESVYLECHYCRHKITDTIENRTLLNKNGKYILTKGGEDTRKISYRWNALADKKVKWSILVEEWLFANDMLKFEGNDTYKNIFIQKRLAKSLGKEYLIPQVELDDSTYDPNKEWKDEKTRFLVCDVQEKSPKLWWLIRAFAENGDSRLIAKGYCEEFDELEKIQLKHNVKYNRVFVDSGNDTQDIYEECAKHGKTITAGFKSRRITWTATKGLMKKLWEHNHNGQQIFKPYSTEQYRGVVIDNKAFGCPLYVFSNYHIKNLLFHLISGKGAKWQCGVVDDEYKKQMGSEILVTEKIRGREERIWKKVTESARNEWWDLEVLTVFAASLNSLLGLSLEERQEKEMGNESNI